MEHHCRAVQPVDIILDHSEQGCGKGRCLRGHELSDLASTETVWKYEAINMG